jgi:hypothetical protein
VIDAALRDPHEARRLADLARFAVDEGFYPGIRAPLPDALRNEITGLVRGALRVGDPAAVVLEDATFGIICRPPAALLPAQRLPHYDGTSPDLLAGVLYLSPHPVGGTAFYRHVGTKMERIDPSSEARYHQALGTDIATHGPPPPGYFATYPGVFERIAECEARFNRLLLYPGNLLHSGLIANDPPPIPCRVRGRLTITCFLSRRPEIG